MNFELKFSSGSGMDSCYAQSSATLSEWLILSLCFVCDGLLGPAVLSPALLGFFALLVELYMSVVEAFERAVSGLLSQF